MVTTRLQRREAEREAAIQKQKEQIVGTEPKAVEETPEVPGVYVASTLRIPLSILQQTHIRNYYNHTHLDQAYNV